MTASWLLAFLSRNRWRITLGAVILIIVVVFYALGYDRYLDLDAIHRQQAWLIHMYRLQPALWLFLYAAVYVAITGLSLPLSVPITLVGGAVLGVLWGSVIVTFAAAFGATLSFWAARYLFRDWVQRRFPRQLATINRGIERDGMFYLFLLRLIPAFPFFLINLAMGLTPMRTRSYFWVSLVGMIPGTVLYVNAGARLAEVRSLHDFLSPLLIGSLIAIGVFPLLVKKLVDLWRRRCGADKESPSNSPFPPEGGKGEGR